MNLEQIKAIAQIFNTAVEAGLAVASSVQRLGAFFVGRALSADEVVAIENEVVADATRRRDERRQMAGGAAS